MDGYYSFNNCVGKSVLEVENFDCWGRGWGKEDENIISLSFLNFFLLR